MLPMKAWIVNDLPDCEYVAIVFAETAGKAKSYCSEHDDIIGDVDFIHVSARRCKEADKYFRGVQQMDWDDDDDRVLMVKELGFYCNDEVFDPECCKECPATRYCDKYKEWKEETDEEE